MSKNFATAIAPLSKNFAETAVWEEMSMLPENAFAPGSMDALPNPQILNNYEKLQNVINRDPVLRDNEFMFQVWAFAAASAEIVSLASALLQSRVIRAFSKSKLNNMRNKVKQSGKKDQLLVALMKTKDELNRNSAGKMVNNLLNNMDQKALNRLLNEQVNNVRNTSTQALSLAPRKTKTGLQGAKKLVRNSIERQKKQVELLKTCNKILINFLLAASFFMILSANVVDEMNQFANLQLRDVIYMRQLILRFFVIMGKSIPLLTDRVAVGVVTGAELLFGKFSPSATTAVRGVTSVLLSSPLFGKSRVGDAISTQLINGLEIFNLQFRNWAQVMSGKVAGKTGLWLAGMNAPADGMIGQVLKAARGALPANQRIQLSRDALQKMNVAMDGVRNICTSLTFTIALSIVAYEFVLMATRATADRFVPSGLRERGIIGSAIETVRRPAIANRNNRNTPRSLALENRNRNNRNTPRSLALENRNRNTLALPSSVPNSLRQLQNYSTNNNEN